MRAADHANRPRGNARRRVRGNVRIGATAYGRLVMIAATFPAVFAVAVVSPPTAIAQPVAGGMPNLREISGRPLPDKSMAVGTVSVRLARKSLSTPVTDAEIVGIVRAAGGDSRKRTAKTDAGGRAQFDGLVPGDSFHAEVTVDGEMLKTDTFTVPEAGGVRTMLVAALGAAGAGGGDPAGPDTSGAGTADSAPAAFTLGMITGTATPDPGMERGTIAVKAFDEAGRPLANQTIEVGQVSSNGQVQVTRQVTDAAGAATFRDVGGSAPDPTRARAAAVAAKGGTPAATPGADATGGSGAPASEGGAGMAAAVVMSVGDVRVGTDGFPVPATGGVRVELRVPQRTSDPSAIVVGDGGRIVLQIRDDSLAFIETLPLQNISGKIFDPGAGGIEMPLPSEAVGTEGAEGEHRIEVRKSVGVAIHGTIPPRRPVGPNQKSPDEVTFGFVLPVRGSTLTFEQKFPNGMGEYTFVTEQLAGLVIESEQISGRQDRELGPKKYWLMRGAPIPVGGTLRFKVLGLPAVDGTGKIVASVLAVGLLMAAVVLSRKPSSSGNAAKVGERERLVERREKLFAELISLESRRSSAAAGVSPAQGASTTSAASGSSGVAATSDPAGAAGASAEAGAAAAGAAVTITAPPAIAARNELVRKLENVYRELATLDERRAS